MTSKELSQVVIPPDAIDELEAALLKALEAEESPRFSWRLRLQLGVACWLHYVGIHHWIKMRIFDHASNRIIDTGDWICAYCSAARHG